MPSVSVYLPDEELRALDAMAAQHGLSRSGAVAKLLVLREEWHDREDALETRLKRLEEVAGL